MDGLLVLVLLVSLLCLASIFGVDSRDHRDAHRPSDAKDRAWWPNGQGPIGPR